MAKTIENYIRAVDPVNQQKDQDYVTQPGSLLAGSWFVPGQSLPGIEQIQEDIGSIFGAAKDQVFTVDREMKYVTDTRGVVVATGICALPMDYNRLVTPSEPGTAQWINAESRQPFVLPQNIPAAVEQIIANPPPLSIANLMKAGGVARAKTILIEEVDFYTQWTMRKLRANAGTDQMSQTTTEAMATATEQFRDFIRVQYDRNTAAFTRLRRLALGTSWSGQPLVRVVDSDPIYQQAIDEQSWRWRRDVPNGDQLDTDGLRVASFYSMASTRAFRGVGALSANEQLMIAEGAANVVVPKNGSNFNDTRRRLFAEILKSDIRPLMAGYPSPTLGPRVRGQALEALSVMQSPSSWEPDLQAYIRIPKRGYAAAEGPVVSWSYALPGTPGVKAWQAEAIREQGGASSEQKLLDCLVAVTKVILNED